MFVSGLREQNSLVPQVALLKFSVQQLSEAKKSNILEVNLIKPTGYGMHQKVEYFNKCKLCPRYIYVFCICLSTNSDLCAIYIKVGLFIQPR
jgi:hypothetical protein